MNFLIVLYNDPFTFSNWNNKFFVSFIAVHAFNRLWGFRERDLIKLDFNINLLKLFLFFNVYGPGRLQGPRARPMVPILADIHLKRI